MRVSVVVVAAASACVLTSSAPVIGAPSAVIGAASPIVGLHPGAESFFAPPPEGAFSEPAPIERPTCKASQIEAAAFTESSPDGVLGVVELEGTKHYDVKHFGELRCSLPIVHGPRGFLDANGKPLGVQRGRVDKINRANDAFGNIPLNNGKAAWGFGWFGFYCGVAPRYVVMHLTGGRGDIDVPYDGPTPTCPSGGVGSTASMLTDGSAGGPGSAVQPAPPSFVSLTTSARFVGTTTTHSPASLEVTISDRSTQAVELKPCPIYELDSTDRIGKRVQFGSTSIDDRTPGCKHADVVVRPGEPVTFRISGKELTAGSSFSAKKGSTFEASVDLAGMPKAKASTTVE
ncbi:MAG TPA: hypothetical protein VHC43_00745 [Mycobacteriales bacterium]|nr:hypothetical protein [Mycobacteriales bacterium]